MHRITLPVRTERLASLLAACLALSAGCDPDPDPPADDDDSTEVLTDIDNLPGGNPLVPDVAMYPFPSDFYLTADESTVTGRRTAYSDEALPPLLAASTLEAADGFSRAPAMLAWFDGGIDPETLPDPDDPSAAMADASSVWVVREGSWERVPLLVELDANAETPAQQALIIRPMDSLDASTGYVVILRDGLRSPSGDPLPVSDAFRALRDDIATDCPEVESQRGDFALVQAAIEASGVPPDEVVLAWSFHTRSDEALRAPLLAMHDVAAAWSLEGWVVDSDGWDEDGENRLIRGRFPTPDFLGEDQRVVLDADGAPVVHGTADAPFLLTIPASVADETRPVIAFGHGFFSAIEEPTWSSLNDGLREWRMSALTTEFIGFNEADLVATIAILGADLNRTDVIISQQMQSQANFTLLARLASEELAAVVEAEDGTPLLDSSAVHYMGISNGGTQGIPILAASPEYTRGVLVVPGGAWTHMIQRAVQFNTLGGFLTELVDGPLELQLVLALLQQLFDPIDAAGWMEPLTGQRPPGRPPVAFAMHEAVGDCQVANILTEWMARAGDVPLIVPTAREVWGLRTVTAEPPDGTDETGVLFMYDEGFPPLPNTNVPPTEDNGAHGDVRYLPAYREQVRAFLEDGILAQVCDGACDPD